MDIVTQIILIIILLALSGFFSGSEVALISLSKHRVKYMINKKMLGASFVKKLKDDPQRMLSTILIGNNLVNIAASAIATTIMIQTFQNYAVSIATGIMTLLILIFGEITPKSIALHNNEPISQIVAMPIWYLSKVLAPILNLLNALVNKIMSVLGIKAEKRKITEEEIISIINTAEKEGSIKEMEKKMINNIFEFDDINVGKIATPETDMITIASNSTTNGAIKLIAKKKFSRLPVYDKTRDNIVGIVYVKDVIKETTSGNKSISVDKIMKKPYFVPDSKKISSLLGQFQKKKEQMAIVINEHGAVTGLVTMEDVLEEIVGEIMDETDKEDLDIIEIKTGTWIAQGKTSVADINDKLSMDIKGKRYDTLNGFLLNYTGKIPKKGDKIVYKDFTIVIEEMEGNKISKVRIDKK